MSTPRTAAKRGVGPRKANPAVNEKRRVDGYTRPETYRWLEAERHRRGLTGKGDVLDMLVARELPPGPESRRGELRRIVLEALSGGLAIVDACTLACALGPYGDADWTHADEHAVLGAAVRCILRGDEPTADQVRLARDAAGRVRG